MPSGYRDHRFPLCGHVERVWFSGEKTFASCEQCAQRRRDAVTAKPGLTREPTRSNDSSTHPINRDYPVPWTDLFPVSAPAPAPEPSPPSFDSGGGGDFGGGGASGEF